MTPHRQPSLSLLAMALVKKGGQHVDTLAQRLYGVYFITVEQRCNIEGGI